MRNEAKKLYAHVIPNNSKVLCIGNTHALFSNINKSDFLVVATLEELTAQQLFDVVIVQVDQANIHDIQTFLEQLKSSCHSGTRIIFDWPATWWWVLPGKNAEYAFSMTTMEQLLFLANFQRITAGTYGLFPWQIPGITWFFNSFLARLPLVGALCSRRWLVMRPLQMHNSAAITVSVIVPCRNEAGNIEEAVKRIPKMGEKTEIIFVEGHSKDTTLEEIKRVAALYPERNVSWCVQPGKGKGDAVRAGFSRAQGDVLIILDADLTVEPEELPKFFAALVQGRGELMNGSRLIYPMEDKAMQTLNWWANHFFAKLFSWLMGQKVTDTLCGTKVLWRKDYERIAANRSYFGEFDPFGDFDLLFGAAKLNIKIVDVPVHYKNRVYGTTQIRRFVHGWLLLGMCLYAMRKLKFY